MGRFANRSYKRQKRGGVMFLFLVGLIVGLAWGAGGLHLLQGLPNRKKRAMDRKTNYILLQRLRALRDEAFN